MIAKTIQLGFAGSMLLTSLYMSLGFNECDCDNARVYIPNQIVMIMGVLGVVFTVCNCGFNNTPFGNASNTLIPGFIGMVCSIIMLTGDSKCNNCCDEDDASTCPEGKKLTCCVSKSKALWAQLAISLVLAGWGSWSTIASYSKKKAIKAGKFAGTKAVEAGKFAGKKAVEAKDNFAERMKKAKAKKKVKKQKDSAEQEGDDDYLLSDFN